MNASLRQPTAPAAVSTAHKNVLPTRSAKLRQMLQSPQLEFLMESHNGLSARIVRDNNEASWTQVVDVLEFMADASDLPILLDGDTGYGNFNNLRRLVRSAAERLYLSATGTSRSAVVLAASPGAAATAVGVCPGPGGVGCGADYGIRHALHAGRAHVLCFGGSFAGIRRPRRPAGLTYALLRDALKSDGFVIYAGQGELSKTLFRISTMGNLTSADIERLLSCFARLL
jgi:hypothetical protein